MRFIFRHKRINLESATDKLCVRIGQISADREKNWKLTWAKTCENFEKWRKKKEWKVNTFLETNTCHQISEIYLLELRAVWEEMDMNSGEQFRIEEKISKKSRKCEKCTRKRPWISAFRAPSLLYFIIIHHPGLRHIFLLAGDTVLFDLGKIFNWT